MSRALICMMAVLAAAPVLAAEPASLVNTIRMQGCKGQPAAGSAVRASASLDGVTRELSRGSPLGRALEQGAYSAMSSTSIHIEGTRDPSLIERVLRDRYCAAVNNPAFSEIGVFQRGTDTWLVLAEPFAPPDPQNQEAVAREVLELVNAARQRARKCGRRQYQATGPLELSAKLSQVARLHAGDMAVQGLLQHRGSDGSRAEERVTRAGYRWQTTAENIAAGQPGAGAVVAHWLDSPGHCANIMGGQFEEMGVGFAIESQGRVQIYWTQVFATPRQP